MNEYCFKLNLNLEPLRQDVDINTLPKERWNLIPIDLINPELINFLKTKEVSISVISSFYDGGTNFDQNIHIDAPSMCDMTKLIWVWGQHHIMNWYLPEDQNNCNFSVDSNSTNPDHGIRNYSSYDRQTVKVVHTSKIGFPSLIQVGIPHKGINFAGVRRSLTVILNDLNNNIIPMNRAKSIFESYIETLFRESTD